VSDSNITKSKSDCGCEVPSKCIREVQIILGQDPAIVPEYILCKLTDQSAVLPKMYVHDIDGKGRDITINIMPKGCISEHDNCPNGAILGENTSSQLLPQSNAGQLNIGPNKLTLLWTADNMKTSVKKKIGDFLESVVLGRLEKIPCSYYKVIVNECQNSSSIVEETAVSPIDGGLMQFYELSPLTILDETIHVLPRMEWEVGLKIGLDTEGEELSVQDRRDNMTRLNAQNNQSNRGHGGWTRRAPGMKITNKITIEGEASYKYGAKEKKYIGTILDKEFLKYRQTMPLLQCAEGSIDRVTSIFSDTNAEFQLLDIDFIYPALALKGKGRLQLTNKNVPYIERGLGIALDPLIGIKFTVDLVTAFCKIYDRAGIINEFREKMAANQDTFDKGGNASYIGLEVKLFVEGQVSLGIDITSDENNTMDYKFDDLKMKLTIGGSINIRAGTRHEIFGGYYKMEGRVFFEAGIKADIAFDIEKKKGIDGDQSVELIYSHDGIVAHVKGGAQFKIEKSSDQGDWDDFETDEEGAGVSEDGVTEVASIGEEWIILKPLSKTESTYKVQLFG
jgi:hypothetical protein